MFSVLVGCCWQQVQAQLSDRMSRAYDAQYAVCYDSEFGQLHPDTVKATIKVAYDENNQLLCSYQKDSVTIFKQPITDVQVRKNEYIYTLSHCLHATCDAILRIISYPDGDNMFVGLLYPKEPKDSSEATIRQFILMSDIP